MGIRNTKNNFGSIAKFFHWITVALILVMMALGIYMHELELSPLKFELYAFHKSLGMIVLTVVLLRLAWRKIDPPPTPISTINQKQALLAKWAHIFLYACIAGLPISGWMMASASGTPIDMFNSGMIVPNLFSSSESILVASKVAHEIIGNLLICLILVHSLAALKHHFCDGDNTLRRMLPWSRTR